MDYFDFCRQPKTCQNNRWTNKDKVGRSNLRSNLRSNYRPPCSQTNRALCSCLHLSLAASAAFLFFFKLMDSQRCMSHLHSCLIICLSVNLELVTFVSSDHPGRLTVLLLSFGIKCNKPLCVTFVLWLIIVHLLELK